MDWEILLKSAVERYHEARSKIGEGRYEVAEGLLGDSITLLEMGAEQAPEILRKNTLGFYLSSHPGGNLIERVDIAKMCCGKKPLRDCIKYALEKLDPYMNFFEIGIDAVSNSQA